MYKSSGFGVANRLTVRVPVPLQVSAQSEPPVLTSYSLVTELYVADPLTVGRTRQTVSDRQCYNAIPDRHPA